MYRFLLICILAFPLLNARGGGHGGGGDFGGDRGGDGRGYGDNRSADSVNRGYDARGNDNVDNRGGLTNQQREQTRLDQWDRNHEDYGTGGGYGYGYDAYGVPLTAPVGGEFPDDAQSNNYFDDPNWPNVQPGDEYNNSPN